MENLRPSGILRSMFKERSLAEFVVVRKARRSDLEAIGELLVTGVSLHKGCFWGGVETKSEWLNRVNGASKKSLSEEIQVALLGKRILGAFALVEMPIRDGTPGLYTPVSFRFFTIAQDFYSESLARMLFSEAVTICRRWNQTSISAEVFSASHPLIPAMEEFGFQRIYGEDAEQALLYLGSRIFSLPISEQVENCQLAQQIN